MKKNHPMTTVALALAAALAVSRALGAYPPAEGTSVSDVVFVAFDVETTGFSPYQERIVEIAAVKFKNGEVLAQKEWLIKPDVRISYWAEQTHGISMDKLEDAPAFQDIYPEIMKFIEGTVLFAHNARFDVAFLREETKRNDLKQPDEACLDTMRLFRSWWPNFLSHNIEAIMDQLGLEADVYHRALADTLYIVEIFNEGMKTRQDDYTFGQLVQDSNGLLFFSEE